MPGHAARNLIQRKDGRAETGQSARMWPYHPDLLAKPVPRYTSYPTAADFAEIAPSCHAEALERVEDAVSLYLHIPFCEKICFYCGCNTSATGRRQRLETYLLALKQEIATVAGHLPAGTPVKRIAFGGGSPNAIAPEDFLQLVETLGTHFNIEQADWSIELDPRTMTRAWNEAISQVGISSASLGVQTFAAHCQGAIGRVQGESVIARTVEWLRDAGVTSLNFDLMYGLPFQTEGDLADTLDRSISLGADRIALFGYAHVPHIVPRQKVIDATRLPDQQARFDMAWQGFERLTESDYRAIGFDHFAKPGDPLALAAADGSLRRNFQGFTTGRARTLIGLGASAISSYPDLLSQNEKNTGRYRMLSSQGLLSANHGTRRSADDRYRGAVIEGLLCRGSARLGACLLHEVRAPLQPFVERGLARLDDQWLCITEAGRPYARTIAALFDGYRPVSARQFSSAV